MCCCGKPTVNGQRGYRWNGPDVPESVFPVHPPKTEESDTLLYDLPGRCGEIDAHSHHYRVVRRHSSVYLLVRHGAGDEQFRIHDTANLIETLNYLDSDSRYWLLHAIYYAHYYGAQNARETTNQLWLRAAAEKRIKTRKRRGSATVKVWIEEAVA